MQRKNLDIYNVYHKLDYKKTHKKKNASNSETLQFHGLRCM